MLFPSSPWVLTSEAPGVAPAPPSLGDEAQSASPLPCLTLPCPLLPGELLTFKKIFWCVCLVATGRTNLGYTGSLLFFFLSFFFFYSVEYFIYLRCVSLEVIYSYASFTVCPNKFVLTFRGLMLIVFFTLSPNKVGSFDHFNSACRCPHLCALL